MDGAADKRFPHTLLAGVFILSVSPLLIVEMFPGQLKFVMEPSSYLVFHNIAEFFSIMVSLSMFGMSWYTFEQSKDQHALFLGTAFLAIGLMDFMHGMSMPSMPGFITPNDPQKSVQFWMPARLFQGIAFLASAYIYRDKPIRWLSKGTLLTTSLLVSGLVFIGIIFFHPQMPTFFVLGVGVTPLKKYCEYLVIFLLCAATAAYWRRMEKTGDRLLIYYVAAFIVSIFSELPFAIYSRAFDTYNALGHINKVIAFFLIYYGVYRASVKSPYLRLREVSEKLKDENAEKTRAEMALREAHDLLEIRVQERTAELVQSNERLQKEIENRRKAEEEVRESEQRFSTLYSSMTEGVAQHEVIYNSIGHAIDYIIWDVNPAFETITGLSKDKVVGKKASDIYGTGEAPYLDLFSGVASSGQAKLFETYFPPMEKYFSISVFSPGKGRFATIFRDITESKRAEEDRQRLLAEVQAERDKLQALINSITDEVWLADTQKKFTLANPSAIREFTIHSAKNGIDVERFAASLEVYRPDGSLRPVEEAPPLRALQGEVIRNQEEMIRTPVSRELRYRQVSSGPVRDGVGNIIGSVSVVRDITEHKQAEEAVRRGEARFKLLSDTAGRLLITDNPQGIVNELCRDVMTHLDCQVFFNFLVDENAGRLHLNACAGIREEEIRKIEWLDFGVAVCGCAARDGARIVATDIFNTPDVRTELVKSFGIQAYACHPLISQDRVIGTLSFGTKTRASFAADDLALMKTVADQVATAMERMRLIKELQISRSELEKRVRERTEELAKSQNRLQQLSAQLLLAQEKERKRVAVELHDGLLSELAATKYLLEGKVMLLDRGKSLDAGELRRVADILGGAMKEARRLMNNLHPSMLDELGLIATIGWLCTEYLKAYPHFTVQKQITIFEEDIADEIKVVIYRVLQEALNNFARHGKGDRVDLFLSKSNGALVLTIRDNGQGFDVETAQKGVGLESMRERVEFSGGKFQLESVIGQGTTIRAIWSI